MFDNIKDAMTFTKGERTAIITLAAVILLIIAANFFIANRPSNVNFSLHNLDSIVALHEKSLQTTDNRQQTLESRKRKTSESQNSKKLIVKNQKQKSHSKTHSSESKSKSESASVSKFIAHSSSLKLHLNSADTTELKSLPGIGSYFARNIVSYRERLGGFVESNQLLEVYAFDSTRLEIIKSHIVIDSIETRKIRINHDDFKTILRHPYIEYEDVKKIVNYRESRGVIKNWEMYLEVVGRTDVDDKLKRYLDF